MSLVASIPSPSDGVLHIGPLAIHAYGLMIALGVVAAVWLAGRRMEAAGVGTRDDMSSIALWAVFVFIQTVRHRDYFLPSTGVGNVFTAAAPAIPLAQAIGRLGNWWNQELFGRPTTLPWGLEIDDEHLPAGYPSGTTFHPTFLYEALWNLALCALLIVIGKRMALRPGRLLAVYVAGYFTGRFWVEGLRIDPANAGGGLRLNQWVALVVVAAAVLYLFVDRQRHRGMPADVTDSEVIDDDVTDSDVTDIEVIYSDVIDEHDDGTDDEAVDGDGDVEGAQPVSAADGDGEYVPQDE